jgi:hypothetical protein
MRTDEITLFRDARPDVAPYSAPARQQLRAALLTEGTRPAPRPSAGRRRIVAVTGLTAALAVGVTVLQNIDFGDGHPNHPAVLGPVASAGELASRAIRQAAGSAWHPRPDQWGYVKMMLADSSKGSAGSLNGPPDRRVTVETWTGVDGARTASVVNGKVVVRTRNTKERDGQGVASYRYVLSLPTDPNALLAAVTRQAVPTGDAFSAIEVLMRQYVLPPKLRAAMYGALTRIPGVRLDTDVTDAAGRRGVGLYRIEEGYLRDDIIVNPVTYAYMGDRAIAIRDHATLGTDGDTRSVKGQILGWSAQLATAIVDHPGTR